MFFVYTVVEYATDIKSAGNYQQSLVFPQFFTTQYFIQHSPYIIIITSQKKNAVQWKLFGNLPRDYFKLSVLSVLSVLFILFFLCFFHKKWFKKYDKFQSKLNKSNNGVILLFYLIWVFLCKFLKFGVEFVCSWGIF